MEWEWMWSKLGNFMFHEYCAEGNTPVAKDMTHLKNGDFCQGKWCMFQLDQTYG